MVGAAVVALVMSLPKTRRLLLSGFTTSEGASGAWDLVILLILFKGGWESAIAFGWTKVPVKVI